MRIYPSNTNKRVSFEDINLGDTFISTATVTGGRIFMRIFNDDIRPEALKGNQEMAVSLDGGQLYLFDLCEPVIPVTLKVEVAA